MNTERGSHTKIGLTHSSYNSVLICLAHIVVLRKTPVIKLLKAFPLKKNYLDKHNYICL
jgi:hypothetical protein